MPCFYTKIVYITDVLMKLTVMAVSLSLLSCIF